MVCLFNSHQRSSVRTVSVQLARRAGIEIIATAARRDFAYLRELGADTFVDYHSERFVDYHSERFEDFARDVDAVLDLVGGEKRKGVRSRS